MAEQGNESLADKRIAFTGRLASMPRRAAEELVIRRGGTVGRTVSRCTDLLVVGQEGWPLKADGRPTNKLRRAKSLSRLGFGIEIVPETEFLQRAGVAEDDVFGLHPLSTLTNIAGVTRRQIEIWIEAGLLAPADHAEGVPLFDYVGVTAVRSLAKLLGSEASPRTLSRSLRSLGHWLPNVEEITTALSRLTLVDGRITFRTSDGRLAEPGGQLQLAYESNEEQSPSVVLSMAEAMARDELFEQALDRESAGDLEAAANLYRRLLLEQGPDADAAFNLGNALHALGQHQAAIERFRQAIELDPNLADAWHNLGNVLLESGEPAEAADAYAVAVSVEPSYADARYGLAGALEETGRYADARPHWRAYLELEPAGECADYARRRLAETEERPTG